MDPVLDQPKGMQKKRECVCRKLSDPETEHSKTSLVVLFLKISPGP